MQSLAESILSSIHGLGEYVSDYLLDRDPRDIIDIIGVEDDTTLIVRPTALMSVFQFDGYVGHMGQEEFSQAVKSLYEAFNPRLMDSSATRFKFIFESDPDASEEALNSQMEAVKLHLDKTNLMLHDIMDESAAVNARYTQVERCWLVVYTQEKAVTGKVVKDSGEINSDQILLDSRELVDYHKTVIHSIAQALNATFRLHLLNVDRVLVDIFSALNGAKLAATASFDHLLPTSLVKERQLEQKHLPNLKIDPNKGLLRFALKTIFSKPESPLEWVSPRPFSHQLVASPIYDSGKKYVISGSRILSPLAAYKYGTTLKDFDHLISRLKRVPFRISFTITPDGLEQSTLSSVLGGIAGFMHTKNRLKEAALSRLQDLSLSCAIPALSITAVTWSKLNLQVDKDTGRSVYSTDELSLRTEKLKAALQDWGGIQMEPCAADLTETFFSTIPGLIGYHCVETVSAPVSDVVQFLPITRPACIYERGAMICRTEDGKAFPISQGGDSADITLVVGGMGYGKSGIIAAFSEAFLAEPSHSSDIPILRGIEFGPSQKAVVKSIQSSLPQDQRHRIRYETLLNTAEYAYNVHDLPMCNRMPTKSHRDFLTSYIVSVTSALADYPSHTGMCNKAVKLAYERYSDQMGNPEAKLFQPNLNDEITAFCSTYGIGVDKSTPWFVVADKLADAGNFRLASIAQRYAVPTLQDYATIATLPEFTNAYKEEFNGMPVTELFKRAINEAVDAIPMAAGYTRFDITNSPVFFADLNALIPSEKSQNPAIMAQRAIIYFTVFRMLCSDIFINADEIDEYNPKYRAYHLERVSKLKPIKKRIIADEIHRVIDVPGAKQSLDQLALEGRKYLVGLFLSTQLLEHHSENLVSLSRRVIVFGGQAISSIEDIKQIYGLSDYDVDVISKLKEPSIHGAEFFVRLKLGDQAKEVKYKLMSTAGPLHLCMIATNGADREVRDSLMDLCADPRVARAAYAKYFPSGRVTDEVERRKRLQANGVYKSQFNNIIKDIIADVIKEVSLR